jgi:hypothetical protein
VLRCKRCAQLRRCSVSTNLGVNELRMLFLTHDDKFMAQLCAARAQPSSPALMFQRLCCKPGRVPAEMTEQPRQNRCSGRQRSLPHVSVPGGGSAHSAQVVLLEDQNPKAQHNAGNVKRVTNPQR